MKISLLISRSRDYYTVRIVYTHRITLQVTLHVTPNYHILVYSS